MYFAAQHVLTGEKVLPTWLVRTYLLHTCGELCLSPVGLSLHEQARAAALRRPGDGHVVPVAWRSAATSPASSPASYDRSHLESLPALFLSIFWYGVIAGAVMLALTPLLKRLMAGVK